MTNSTHTEALVVLNAPPDLEEPIIDWLLAREDSTGFTSFPVYGHSASHAGLSPAEQVSGRRRRQQFQIQIRADDVDGFIDKIQKSFGAAGIHFWVLPMSMGGHLSSAK